MKTKDIVKLGIILLLICGISTGLLAYVNDITEPVIARNNEINEQNARKEVLPEAEEFESEAEGIFVGKKNNEVVGYTIIVTPDGYGGKISMMVGIKKDNTISGVKIISMSETPGLGAKAKDEKFLGQFNGKGKDMSLVKSSGGDNDIVAITGATVTSSAIVAGVKEALLKVPETKGAL